MWKIEWSLGLFIYTNGNENFHEYTTKQNTNTFLFGVEMHFVHNCILETLFTLKHFFWEIIEYYWNKTSEYSQSNCNKIIYLLKCSLMDLNKSNLASSIIGSGLYIYYIFQYNEVLSLNLRYLHEFTSSWHQIYDCDYQIKASKSEILMYKAN